MADGNQDHRAEMKWLVSEICVSSKDEVLAARNRTDRGNPYETLWRTVCAFVECILSNSDYRAEFKRRFDLVWDSPQYRNRAQQFSKQYHATVDAIRQQVENSEDDVQKRFNTDYQWFPNSKSPDAVKSPKALIEGQVRAFTRELGADEGLAWLRGQALGPHWITGQSVRIKEEFGHYLNLLRLRDLEGNFWHYLQIGPNAVVCTLLDVGQKIVDDLDEWFHVSLLTTQCCGHFLNLLVLYVAHAQALCPHVKEMIGDNDIANMRQAAYWAENNYTDYDRQSITRAQVSAKCVHEILSRLGHAAIPGTKGVNSDGVSWPASSKSVCAEDGKRSEDRVVFQGSVGQVVVQQTNVGDNTMVNKPGAIVGSQASSASASGADPQINSPWASGLFYVFSSVVVVSVLGFFARIIPYYTLALIIVADIILVLLVGALQLRMDRRLSEKSFLELVRMAIMQLPLVEKLARWIQGGMK